MNYELLTILVSIILLIVTFMQYYNNKHNFLKEKLPIISIKKIEGAYIKNKLTFMIVIENIGDSPAADVILKCRINEIEKLKYDKVNFLKENNNILIELEFDKKSCDKFIKRLENNKKLFEQAFKNKNDKKMREEILLPVLSIEIYYKNIFDKCFKLTYDRGMYKLDDVIIGDKKFKGINFISENSITFSLKPIRKIKMNKILKNYNEQLPFFKIDEKDV